MKKPTRTASLTERVATLEVEVQALKDQGEETNKIVHAIYEKITVSRGAVLGATVVLSAVVGFAAFLLNGFGSLIADLVNGPPPH